MVNRPDKIGIADATVFYVLKNGNGGNDVEDDWACLFAMFGRRPLPAASRELTIDLLLECVLDLPSSWPNILQ